MGQKNFLKKYLSRYSGYSSGYSRGLINTIILIIIALIILGFFKIDIKTVLAGPVVQDNLKYAWQLILQGLLNVKDMILQTIMSHMHS